MLTLLLSLLALNPTQAHANAGAESRSVYL